nr:MAG TPA: hypothetical protein [Caudoviricetes sp.]
MGVLYSILFYKKSIGSTPMLYNIYKFLSLYIISVLTYLNFLGFNISSTDFPFLCLSAKVE